MAWLTACTSGAGPWMQRRRVPVPTFRMRWDDAIVRAGHPLTMQLTQFPYLKTYRECHNEGACALPQKGMHPHTMKPHRS